MEKSKYEFVTYKNGLYYSFITTTRNTEDCLKRIIERNENSLTTYKSYKIFKTVNGIRQLLLTNSQIAFLL